MSTITRDEIEKQFAILRIPQETTAVFILWLKQHRKVWAEFEKKTLQAIASQKKFGAKAIAEVLRWESQIERREDDEYAINNRYVSLLARLFAIKHPDHSNYFEFREIKQ